MRRMGIEALYRKPHLSRRHPAHQVYPYLLRDLKISRPNHVWAADITYIPLARGFVYLFAVLDWASRRVLAWRLSNTLTTDFCLEAVRDALAHDGTPRHLQYRSRVPIYEPRVHRVAHPPRHSDQHGRKRLLAG
jgi:putative transposase